MRLHVVDGTFELFRAQYSKRPGRIAPDGMDVKGTVGVVASMLGLLDDPEEDVTHIAVAFDNPIESFRNDLFDGYKTGEGMDPILVAQLDLVEEAVAAIGITVWTMDHYEADDALATAARLWRDEVAQVRILDAGQGSRPIRNGQPSRPGGPHAPPRHRRGRASANATAAIPRAFPIGSPWWAILRMASPAFPDSGQRPHRPC